MIGLEPLLRAASMLGQRSLESAAMVLALQLHADNPDVALHAASQPLDGCGTRGAKRFAMKADMEVVVDGERSRLVNLSITGAQLVMPARVQPRQSVLLTLVDERSEKRFRALVAWSTVELAQSMVKYRAGVSFVDPDPGAIEAFCHRNAM